MQGLGQPGRHQLNETDFLFAMPKVSLQPWAAIRGGLKAGSSAPHKGLLMRTLLLNQLMTPQ
jgi:hypothetical protein